MASRVEIVSSTVSPFATDDVLTEKLITSAERRLAATSKEERVRVLFSKNKVSTVRPRRVGTFLTLRLKRFLNGTALLRMKSSSSSVRLWMSSRSLRGVIGGLLLTHTRRPRHPLLRSRRRCAVCQRCSLSLQRNRPGSAARGLHDR